MKRLYYILTGALLLAGCQREDLLPTGDSGKIEFAVSIDGMVDSRAIADVNFNTHGIYIAGYHTEGTIADAVIANPNVVVPNVFNYDIADIQMPVPHVMKDPITGKYTLKTVKWRLDNTSYLNYFAWTQGQTKDAVNGIVNATADNTSKGFPWLDVANSNDLTKQVDIATARYLDQKNDRVVSAIDLTFKHILSKLTFKFKSSSGAKVAFTKMNLVYGANKIYSKGRYTFNGISTDPTGLFANLNTYHTGTTSLGTTHVLDGGMEITAGEMLLIPQSVTTGFLKFDLTYSITHGEQTVTHNKSVELPATVLLDGSNHIYTVDIYAEEIVVHQAMIADWITEYTSRLPFVPGPMGDTQLLLDGYDKPYQHTNNKWYWLDRSGYNRHVEITGTNAAVAYNAANNSYTFDGTTRLQCPYSIGTVTALTLDMVLQASVLTNSTLFEFDNGNTNVRPFFSHFGYTGSGYTTSTIFDTGISTGGNNRLIYASDLKRSMITWQKQDNGNMSLYLNASSVGNKATTGAYNFNAITVGKLGTDFKGEIFYVKLTKAMSPIKDIVKTYQGCAAKYGIPNESTLLPPVQNGLIFCFDGRSGIKTVTPTKYWVDEVGKNDAEIKGNVTWNSTTKGFEFGGTASDLMQMIYPVAMPNDYTIELVFLPQQASSDQSPLQWYAGANRTVAFHFPYSPNPNPKIFVDCPASDRYIFDWDNAIHGSVQISRKIVIRRKYKVDSQFYINNVVMGRGGATTDVQALGDLTRMEFSTKYKSTFYALRVYDRALTNDEMLQNYTYDKKTFGFTEVK